MNAGTLVLAIIIGTLALFIMPRRLACAAMILMAGIGWVIIALVMLGAVRGFR